MKKFKTVLTKNGYIVPKKYISKKKLESIKKELTVKPFVNSDYSDEKESFNVYQEDKNNISLPKYKGIELFGTPDKYVNIKVKKCKMKFKGELRDYQKPIIEQCLAVIKSKGGGILKLPCGRGKTTIAIYMACELKKPTLVIVHKTFLQDQWIERIKQFSNAKIGIIRQNKVDIKKKDIVIGMIQSISMREYDPHIFDQFGTIIIDEVHHAGSRVFSQSLQKLNCQYTIGLSATPKRNDGLSKVFKWYLGDIMYQESRQKNNRVVVKCFAYETVHPKFKPKKMWIKGQLKPAIQKMLTNIAEVEQRNQFIVDIIKALRNQKERKMLILSGRIKHLDIMKDMVDIQIKQEEEDGLLEEDEIKTAYYIGKMKDYQLRDASDADIIFASYQMAEEGLDIKGLNTLIMSTSKTSVVQSVGRILRKQADEYDVAPLIIDMADQFSIFGSQSFKRRKLYIKEGYKIEFYRVKDDHVIDCDKELTDIMHIDPATLYQEEDKICCDDIDPNQSMFVDETPIAVNETLVAVNETQVAVNETQVAVNEVKLLCEHFGFDYKAGNESDEDISSDGLDEALDELNVNFKTR